jgi:uncharacterized protein (DUF1330 family)
VGAGSPTATIETDMLNHRLDATASPLVAPPGARPAAATVRFDRVQLIVGLALAALVAAVFLQQSPGWWRGRLTPAEVDAYLARIDAQVPLPPQQRDEILRRVRAFGAEDDGRPLYMLNVMRYLPKLAAVKGTEGFNGTPAEANARYEAAATPLLLKLGAAATYAGSVRGRNLFGFDAAVDDWSRVLVVRYPSRRAFLDLVSDPAYAPMVPYKLASIDLQLTPTDAEQIFPDYRLAASVIALLVFVSVGWWRAARRRG